ncbi:MAG: cytochrome C oxidase subunit II [Myxococcales bacterium]|nr:cytochrome C oxidase subunit II [Myxococcales bacterium]
MIETFILQASSYAGQIDALIWLIVIITGVWFFAAEGMFFWLLWRFRARPGGAPARYIDDHEEHLLKYKWIEIPHRLILVCDVVLIIGAITVWSDIKLSMPATDETVRITAQQWAWTFQHVGPDGEMDTEDDIVSIDEMHIQVGKTYKFELMAKDVLHSFSVPVFRLKQDAIPGRVITGWFQPTMTGEFDVQCAEICGIGHAIMPARLYVETPEAHAAWLATPTHYLAYQF